MLPSGGSGSERCSLPELPAALSRLSSATARGAFAASRSIGMEPIPVTLSVTIALSSRPKPTQARTNSVAPCRRADAKAPSGRVCQQGRFRRDHLSTTQTPPAREAAVAPQEFAKPGTNGRRRPSAGGSTGLRDGSNELRPPSYRRLRRSTGKDGETGRGAEGQMGRRKTGADGRRWETGKTGRRVDG